MKIIKNNKLNRTDGLAPFFLNGISTFMGYLMSKPS